jgi:hypothetical protein
MYTNPTSRKGFAY